MFAYIPSGIQNMFLVTSFQMIKHCRLVSKIIWLNIAVHNDDFELIPSSHCSIVCYNGVNIGWCFMFRCIFISYRRFKYSNSMLFLCMDISSDFFLKVRVNSFRFDAVNLLIDEYYHLLLYINRNLF